MPRFHRAATALAAALALAALPRHAAAGGAASGAASAAPGRSGAACGGSGAPGASGAAAARCEADDAKDLLGELQASLGRRKKEVIESRVAHYRALIEPTFDSLPRGANGRLRWDGVSYLLHRVFVASNGWHLRGLFDASGPWAETMPENFLAEHVGFIAQRSFRSRLDGRGMSLSEVSILAATLDAVVREDIVRNFRAASSLVGLTKDSVDSEMAVLLSLDVYMTLMRVGKSLLQDLTAKGKTHDIEALQELVAENSDAKSQDWVRGVLDDVANATDGLLVSSESALAVVEEAIGRYGKWSNEECVDLTRTLRGMEQGRPGYVPLRVFYAGALSGTAVFSESRDYLRSAGALDESDPARPAVIVANYMLAASNCLYGSQVLSQCCLTPCEAVLGHFERAVAAPQAPPERLLEAAARLPADAAEPPPLAARGRLERRLAEVADKHGGSVPLHGRLFAQWLHHAYPRACPYPHVSGTTAPMPRGEYELRTGRPEVADADALRWEVEHLPRTGPGRTAGAAPPWSSEEELYVRRPAPAEAATGGGPSPALLAEAAATAAALALAVAGGGYARRAAAAKSRKVHSV